ncbi:oxidoreductase [Cryptosporidium xiaoi]|uniref:Oxidoreductase n=1 Tax=Cryptosporidium xiaoi TaxID=659607 RepID=A0AAV9XVZ2_9CRYT
MLNLVAHLHKKTRCITFLIDIYLTLFFSLIWYLVINIIYSLGVIMSGSWIIGKIWPLNLIIVRTKKLLGLNLRKIEEKDLSGKVCIVTGGARGIGKRVATYFVNCGATVIIADYLEDEGRILAFKLNTKKKVSNGFARYMYIDLEDRESIKAFVKRFIYDYDRLDILINNAGIGTANNINIDSKRKKSNNNLNRDVINNINKIFKINYLGTFVLTESLIPILKNTKGSRIVNTSSPTHRFFGSNILKILECSQILDYDFAYGASKSALLLYTLKLRRNAMGLTPGRCSSTEMSLKDAEYFPWSTCVNPGSVNSKIFKNAFPYNLIWIFKWFLLDFKKGSETTIFASICPKEQATLYMTPYWLPGNGSWFIDKYADFLSIYVGPHFGVPYLNEDAALSAEFLFEWTRNIVES